MANARNATKKRVTLTRPKPKQTINDIIDKDSEILEGDLLEGPGTYQGGPKSKGSIDKKLNEKKKSQMKRDRQILNNSTDILSHLNEDTDGEASATPRTEKRTTRRRRVSAAGCRLVENPLPDVPVMTPKRTHGKISI